jgi:hypothetical protein
VLTGDIGSPAEKKKGGGGFDLHDVVGDPVADVRQGKLGIGYSCHSRKKDLHMKLVTLNLAESEHHSFDHPSNLVHIQHQIDYLPEK